MDILSFSLDGLATSSQIMLPLFLLLGTGLILMLLDAFNVRQPLPWIAGVGMMASGVLAYIGGVAESRITFFGMMETGGVASMVHLFLCLAGTLTLFFLTDYLKRYDRSIPDVYALITFSVIGMILLANANDLIISFIGLETMSICLYIFAALYKTDPRSNEAGIKYFLLGSFASTFLLFGIALIYGLTGFTNYSVLSTAEVSNQLAASGPMFYMAIGLILIGFLFKVSAFPFHNWTPDVYEGTPTPLAGFMATGGKMAAFIALAVILQKFNIDASPKLLIVIALASLFTMLYGNVVAARQDNIKRMLAYSSIAHSGYVLLGLTAIGEGFDAVVFYMFIYTLMNIGAFGMVGMAESSYEDTMLDRWQGLGKRAPIFAGGLAIFMFSLAGIPPLAGFMSKYQIFLSAIEGGQVLLAVIGILASVVGAYYYIRVIVRMFFQVEAEEQVSTQFNAGPMIGVGLLALAIIILGVFPSLILEPIQQAFQTLTEGVNLASQ